MCDLRVKVCAVFLGADITADYLHIVTSSLSEEELI